jgi:uracil-DNA glycosylase family protein
VSAAEYVPDDADLDHLAQAAAKCRGCELYEDATQTVFGEGPPSARVVLVGEQPGDQEDRKGEPFVGPAGRLLDRALEQAGIARDDAYVTNAVKHFRFTQTGKRRIHQTPDLSHITACKPWLDAELALLAPEVVVVLGATAAKALLGPSFRVTKQRGQLMPFEGRADGEDAGVHNAWILATVHPSSVLRGPEEQREQAFQALVDDLAVAAKALG